jgi:hypothetical protein
MLEAFDSLRILVVSAVFVGQHLLELSSSVRDVNCHLNKKSEVLLLFRQEI